MGKILSIPAGYVRAKAPTLFAVFTTLLLMLCFAPMAHAGPAYRMAYISVAATDNWREGFSIFLNMDEKRCKDGLGEYVHFGATTQDVVDTGGVLAIRDATKILLRDAVRLEKALLALAQKYASFPMAGRTHHQQGLPITLGLKFANWAAELRRCIERVLSVFMSPFRESQSFLSLFPVQNSALSGARIVPLPCFF